MKCRVICLSVMLLLVAAAVAGASVLSDLSRDLAGIAKQAGPSSVRIEVERDLPYRLDAGLTSGGQFKALKSIGSGFVIDANGMILTTCDVVANAKSIKVAFADGSSAEAKLLGSDTLTDTALIKAEKTGLKAATLGDSDAIEPGMLVVTLNSQAGMANSVALGVVAATDREAGSVPGLVMQISGTVGPGSSGGPVLDTEGRVVGMTFAMFSPTSSAMPFNMPKIIIAPPKSGGKIEVPQMPEVKPGGVLSPEDMTSWLGTFKGAFGIDSTTADPNGRSAVVSVASTSSSSGFAIPINRIKLILSALKAGKPVERAMMGIELKQDDTGIVLMPAAGSPAEKAGVKIGDVLVSIDGHRFARVAGVVGYVTTLKPGDKVDLVVKRDGKEMRVAVTTVLRVEKTVETPELPSPGIQPKIVDRESIFSLNLEDAGIAEVAKALSESSGKNVVVVNPENIKGKVTVHLKSATVETALSFICDVLKCRYTKSAQGYVIQALK